MLGILPLSDIRLYNLGSQVSVLPAVSVLSSLLGSCDKCGGPLHSKYALDLLLLSPVVFSLVGSW